MQQVDKIVSTKAGKIIRFNDYLIGTTYRINYGWGKGTIIKLDWIGKMHIIDTATPAKLLTRQATGIDVSTGKSVNTFLSHLSTDLHFIQDKPDREALIRKTAQKFLLAGNKEAAKKLLAVLLIKRVNSL